MDTTESGRSPHAKVTSFNESSDCGDRGKPSSFSPDDLEEGKSICTKNAHLGWVSRLSAWIIVSKTQIALVDQGGSGEDEGDQTNPCCCSLKYCPVKRLIIQAIISRVQRGDDD